MSLQGALSLPDEDAMADLYDTAVEDAEKVMKEFWI
jgi:hypothetical protein